MYYQRTRVFKPGMAYTLAQRLHSAEPARKTYRSTFNPFSTFKPFNTFTPFKDTSALPAIAGLLVIALLFKKKFYL